MKTDGGKKDLILYFGGGKVERTLAGRGVWTPLKKTDSPLKRSQCTPKKREGNTGKSGKYSVGGKYTVQTYGGKGKTSCLRQGRKE